MDRVLESIAPYLTRQAAMAAVCAYPLYQLIYALFPGDFMARFNKMVFWKNKFAGNESEYILRNYRQYGNIFLVGPRKIALCDPSDCRAVLSTHAFRKDKDYEHVTFIEPNLVTSVDPEANKQRRRQVGPTFNPASLRKMQPKILECGILPVIEHYYNTYMLMTFDVISVLAFGRYFDALRSGNRQLINWIEKSMALLVSEMIFPGYKIRRSVDELIAFGKSVIDERKQKVREGIEPPADILQSFIDAEDPESKIKMTPSEVVSESIVTIIAGTDTTSSSLCWTTHLMLLHPVWYKRVKEEVRAAFDRDHIITYEEAKAQLPLMEACVYESMRIRPVAGNVARVVPQGGATFQGHFIPEGYSADRMNADVWENPHVFNPDRFLANPEMKQQLLTFSAGVRVCPGKHLAYVEIFVTLANLISRFNFELPEDSLFGPEVLGEDGEPVIMPRKHTLLSHPRFPERDCNIVITKR
ncbi:cytochrome P450 [Linderina pennispora]|uniref:Cytochrome P450 n=1 Tax=Linderina pennispora TaxID=61395 RepID=A0A1Y1WHM1_9FUNG|nr:cytochrome P450 [Linderina pennispora]ORX73071.1 cytochrome P450 [Linderina pennispora]